MKDNKPKDVNKLKQLSSKKYLGYGTASALTLALYLFSGNASAHAEQNNSDQPQDKKVATTSSEKSDKTVQTTPATSSASNQQNTNNQQPADTQLMRMKKIIAVFTKYQFYMLQSGWMKTAIF